MYRILLLCVCFVTWGWPAAGQNNDDVENPEQFYLSLPPEERKRIREQSLNEFLDVDMFLDVITSRRFNYVTDNHIAGRFGNRKLRQTIDYFKAKTHTGVCVRCLIDKQHFWVKYLSGKNFHGNCDTISGGYFNLLFDIHLTPEGNNTYRPKITCRTDDADGDSYNTQYINEENWNAFKQYINEELPSMQRSVFIDKFNERIVNALLKLLGNQAPPISVTITPNNACAYDSCSAEKLREYYDDIDIPGVPTRFYTLPKAKWASVKKGTSLQVTASAREWLPDSTTTPLQLKLDNGWHDSFTSKDSAKQFTVSGFREGDNTLKAVQQLESERGVDILAGQLSVAAYKEQKLKLVLVPLQGTAIPDEQTIQTALNNIYRQAIIQWDVNVSRSMEEYSETIELPDDMNDQQPYCPSMETVIKDFKDRVKPDKNTRYIFLIKEFATGRNDDIGYMPFAHQYGFVKTPDLSDQQIVRTIAHELGHGAFGLKHSFDPEYGMEHQGNNLMDYSHNHHLSKFQWDIIHNSSAGETAFDSTNQVMAWLWNDDARIIRELIEKFKRSYTENRHVSINRRKNENVNNGYMTIHNHTYTSIAVKMLDKVDSINVKATGLNLNNIRYINSEEWYDIMIANIRITLRSEEERESLYTYITTENSGFEIQLFDGSKRIGKDSIVLITATPSMPDIRAKIVSGNKGTYKMKLEIKFLRQCTGAPNRTPNQIISFPSNGWHEMEEGKEWDVDFGTDAETQRPMIRGGIAYLIAEAPNEVKDTVRFFIKGENPTVQQVNAFLNQAPYNTIWFLKKIIFHESDSPSGLQEEVRQFNKFRRDGEHLSESNWNATSRMPNMGAPCGWGLGQMDNPQPSAQTLWDWKANIIAAYNLLLAKRQNVITHLDKAQKIVNKWNSPGNPVVTHEDQDEGGITYTHASSSNFVHDINNHFGAQPTNNKRSFIDACWMKLYNGLGKEKQHYYWLAPGEVSPIITTPPEWHITRVATYGEGKSVSANYYIQEVSRRAIP